MLLVVTHHYVVNSGMDISHTIYDDPRSPRSISYSAHPFIHAHSEVMRNWLWKDVLRVPYYWENGSCSFAWLIGHAVLGVLSIYCVCTLMDRLRIVFIERPFFKCFDWFLNQKMQLNAR